MIPLPWKAKSNDTSESDQPKISVEKTKKPWLITRVQNGLKAVNGEPTILRFAVNKKFPTQYFEYDRIYGRGAFSESGIMQVNKLFGELQEITPRTEYFIFGDWNYYTREDGILATNRRTKKELFLSNETILNKSVSVFLQLEETSKHGRIDESDSDREEVYRQGSELKAIEDQREL